MSLSGSVVTLVLHDPDARAGDDHLRLPDSASALGSSQASDLRPIRDSSPHALPEAVETREAGQVAQPGPSGFDLSAEYDAHGSALFAFAINALRDRGLAEDAVQETFLRAWRARDRFDASRASARTWLFAIERNVIVDLQRAAGRTSRHTTSDPVDDVPAITPDALERLRLVEALAKLSADQRAVIVAVHLTGQSYSELSEACGVPVATLRTRAFYALRALRIHLDAPEDSNG